MNDFRLELQRFVVEVAEHLAAVPKEQIPEQCDDVDGMASDMEQAAKALRLVTRIRRVTLDTEFRVRVVSTAPKKEADPNAN